VQVAAEVLRVAPTTLTATRIKGGLTNESWLVQGIDDAVVVRISTADEHALQLNRSSETVVLERVQQAGIGAEVLLCAPERRLLVTRKLPAETMTLAAMRDPVMLRPLTALLRRLHSISVPPSVQKSDLLAIVQGYWQTLDAYPAQQQGSVDTRAYATEIALESASATNRCLCHNDVHHLNLMSDGEQLWLLDWEYAGTGDPFFDLAAVCCYHDYSPALRNQLLLAYRGELTDADSLRLQRMCWLFDYIKMLWLTVRALEA
jgi:thiamine kinase-like enzyme